MAVKTPFERHQQSKWWQSTMIYILVILIIILAGASIYLSWNRISTLRSHSIYPTTNITTEGIIWSIWSSITLSGSLSIASSGITDYTHILTTDIGNISLKSSLIDLMNYEGPISIEWIIQTPSWNTPIVDVMMILSGSPTTSISTGDIVTEDNLSWDMNDETITDNIQTWSVQTGWNQPSTPVTNPDTTSSMSQSLSSSNNILSEPSVSQFRINTGQSLTFKINRWFSIVFPTRNIAYQANNINTWLEFGKNIACSVVTNAIVYKDQSLVNESPSVQIYECITKNSLDTTSIQWYRVLLWNSDRKVFLVKVNDPTWTRFANNIEIYYGDTVPQSVSWNVQ